MSDIKLSDIEINNEQYRVHIASANLRDVIDFAPRAASPGGSIVHSMLDLYQPLMQQSFNHGFGFHWYSDASGYLKSEGTIETRYPGLLMLNTVGASSDTDDNIKEGGVVFNGKFYTWGDGGLREFNGSTWSDIYTTTKVNFALATGTYLFFSPDGARIKKMDTSNTVTDAGLGVNSADYKFLTVYNGYVFANVEGTNRIHTDSNIDLSQLDGDATSDVKDIFVGFNGTDLLGAEVFSGRLYFMRDDGIWLLSEDNTARRVVDYTKQKSPTNFRSVVVHNGFLVYAIRDSIKQWNAVRESGVTPPKVSDSFPFTTYGSFDNFVVEGRYLYMTAKTNETIPITSILCFDGVGWFRIDDVISSTDGEVTMMSFDTANNRLWYHVSKPIAGTEITSYRQIQELSDLPYANFPTTGTHAVTTSRWDMGFRDITKSMVSIRVEGQNLSSTQKATIYYSLDGGAFQEWGGSGNGDIVVDGVTNLTSPDGSSPSEEFYNVKFKIELSTDDSSQSPVIESFTVRFIMRPETRQGWGYDIPLAARLNSGGRVDNRSPGEMLNDLWTARDSKSPILFVDHYNRKFWAYITSLQIRALEETPQLAQGDMPMVESVAHVNIIEAIDYE